MVRPRLGLLSLRLDAIYCVLLGGGVAVAAAPISTTVGLQVPAIVAAGIAVMVWAGLVEWMRAHLDLRLALWIVLSANVVATLAVAMASLTAAALVTAVLILTISVDIALFAISQAIALGRLRTS